MEFRRLGRSGLKVSALCLGTMTFGSQAGREESYAIMDTAVEAGVNFFDTADMYPLPSSYETGGVTEEIIGDWLRERRQRDRIVLATKCYAATSPEPNDSGLSRKHILDAVDASLRRLKTDYIDLYQAHRDDPNTPLEETLRAFDDLVRAGKVRYIGASNYSAWRLAKALWTSDRLSLERYESIQPRYNLLYREIEAELVPLCLEERVGIIAYNPLAGGFLTGKHRRDQGPVEGSRFTLGGTTGQLYQGRYWHESHFDAVDRLKAFFEPRGQSLVTTAVAWVLRQPGITAAIIGASHAAQLQDSLAAVGATLDDEALEVLDQVWYTIPRPRPGSPETR
jgi:aryl-alcohol dehydrogenase-like predicted oxidoreductase